MWTRLVGSIVVGCAAGIGSLLLPGLIGFFLLPCGEDAVGVWFGCEYREPTAREWLVFGIVSSVVVAIPGAIALYLGGVSSPWNSYLIALITASGWMFVWIYDADFKVNTPVTDRLETEDIQVYLRDQMPVWREMHPGVEEMKVAVMGCVVNGPGESKHANLGISLPGTFEDPKAPVYVDGKLRVTLKGDRIVPEFLEILTEYVERTYPAVERVAG